MIKSRLRRPGVLDVAELPEEVLGVLDRLSHPGPFGTHPERGDLFESTCLNRGTQSPTPLQGGGTGLVPPLGC